MKNNSLLREICSLYYGNPDILERKENSKMDSETHELLEEEVKTQIRELRDMLPGSDERKAAIDGIAKLYQIRIDEDQAVQNTDEKSYENKYRNDQLEEAKKDRWLKYGISAAEFVLTLWFYGSWMRRGFKFEEKGAYRSNTFKDLRNLMSKIFRLHKN